MDSRKPIYHTGKAEKRAMGIGCAVVPGRGGRRIIIPEFGRRRGEDIEEDGPSQWQPLQQIGDRVIPCRVAIREHSQSGGLSMDQVPDDTISFMPTYGGIEIDQSGIVWSAAAKSLQLDTTATAKAGSPGTAMLEWELTGASIVDNETPSDKTVDVTVDLTGPGDVVVNSQSGNIRIPLAALRYWFGYDPYLGHWSNFTTEEQFLNQLWPASAYDTQKLAISISRPFAIFGGGALPIPTTYSNDIDMGSQGQCIGMISRAIQPSGGDNAPLYDETAVGVVNVTYTFV